MNSLLLIILLTFIISLITQLPYYLFINQRELTALYGAKIYLKKRAKREWNNDIEYEKIQKELIKCNWLICKKTIIPIAFQWSVVIFTMRIIEDVVGNSLRWWILWYALFSLLFTMFWRWLLRIMKKNLLRLH